MSCKGKHRVVGSNLLQNCKLRQKQMRYLLENMSEPDFSLIECNNALEQTFNTSNDTLNTAGITFRLLNHQGFGEARHDSNEKPSWNSVAYFMACIQGYLPKSLQKKQNPHRLWSVKSFQQNDTQVIAEETQELLNDMVEWIETLKRKIEDYITAHYYREGKIQYCEILKRRFKSEWSERTEQSVEANIDSPKKIEICFEGSSEEEI